MQTVSSTSSASKHLYIAYMHCANVLPLSDETIQNTNSWNSQLWNLHPSPTWHQKNTTHDITVFQSSSLRPKWKTATTSCSSAAGSAACIGGCPDPLGANTWCHMASMAPNITRHTPTVPFQCNYRCAEITRPRSRDHVARANRIVNPFSHWLSVLDSVYNQ